MVVKKALKAVPMPLPAGPAKVDTTPYHASFAVYLLGFFCATILFILTTLVAWNQPTGIEKAIFSWFNGLSESFYRTAYIASALGSAWAAAVVAALAFFRRFYQLTGRLALSMLVGYGAAYAVDYFLMRGAPLALISDVHLRVGEAAIAFPSTHAMAITIMTVTLWPYLRWRVRWVLPLIVIAVVVSRMYLGTNLPLDLLGGIALGTAVVTLVQVIPQSVRVFLRID